MTIQDKINDMYRTLRENGMDGFIKKFQDGAEVNNMNVAYNDFNQSFKQAQEEANQQRMVAYQQEQERNQQLYDTYQQALAQQAIANYEEMYGIPQYQDGGGIARFIPFTRANAARRLDKGLNKTVSQALTDANKARISYNNELANDKSTYQSRLSAEKAMDKADRYADRMGNRLLRLENRYNQTNNGWLSVRNKDNSYAPQTSVQTTTTQAPGQQTVVQQGTQYNPATGQYGEMRTVKRGFSFWPFINMYSQKSYVPQFAIQQNPSTTNQTTTSQVPQTTPTSNTQLISNFSLSNPRDSYAIGANGDLITTSVYDRQTGQYTFPLKKPVLSGNRFNFLVGGPFDGYELP